MNYYTKNTKSYIRSSKRGLFDTIFFYYNGIYIFI